MHVVTLVQVADSADSRTAFRRWARANHPDVGGDPEVFAAGLRASREGRWEQFVAAPALESLPGARTGREPIVPENRVEVYVQRSSRGVVKLYTAARRWNDKRKLPPRVR